MGSCHSLYFPIIIIYPFSPEQDHLRQGVCVAPDNGVLFQAYPRLPGVLQAQSENQDTLFARPMIARVLADALGKGQASPTQFL